eukprot:2133166-Pyramimonas_sp.AAC.1
MLHRAKPRHALTCSPKPRCAVLSHAMHRASCGDRRPLRHRTTGAYAVVSDPRSEGGEGGPSPPQPESKHARGARLGDG